MRSTFKLFLKATADRPSHYINKCITWLNRLIYIAVDQEVIRCNPLEDVRYEKREPSQHRHIGKSELSRIMATLFDDSRLELVRRAFIFSAFTGLAYADIYGLYPRHTGAQPPDGSISASSVSKPTWRRLCPYIR